MKTKLNGPVILLWTGLFVMVSGAVDPLEGSVMVLIGAACSLAGAVIGRKRRKPMLIWALGLVAAGVGILFGLSAIGGVGGDTGRSMIWLLAVLPYPVGWFLAMAGTVLALREKKKVAG
jgi:hypothetical protein